MCDFVWCVHPAVDRHANVFNHKSELELASFHRCRGQQFLVLDFCHRNKSIVVSHLVVNAFGRITVSLRLRLKERNALVHGTFRREASPTSFRHMCENAIYSPSLYTYSK